MNAQSVFGLLTSAMRFRNIFLRQEWARRTCAATIRVKSRYSCAIRDVLGRRSSHGALILCGPIAFLPRLAGVKSGYGAPAPVRLGARHALSGRQFYGRQRLQLVVLAAARTCRDRPS